MAAAGANTVATLNGNFKLLEVMRSTPPSK